MQDQNNVLTAHVESVCNELLNEIYKTDAVNYYDFTASQYGTGEDNFKMMKTAASHLVKEKLAHYADEQHTLLSITNYGRYWILQGGYIPFLKGTHELKEHAPDKELQEKTQAEKHHSKEELLEARLKLTHFRLVGFWLMIVLSLLGFIFSLINFYLLVKGKK